MFFVAFNQRQNKIIQQIEKAEMVALANDRANQLFIEDVLENASKDSPDKGGEQRKSDKNTRGNRPTGPSTKVNTAAVDQVNNTVDPKHPMNVIILKNEVDLE